MKNVNLHLSQAPGYSLIKRTVLENEKPFMPTTSGRVVVYSASELEERRKKDFTESEASVKTLYPRLLRLNYKSLEVVS